VTLNKEEDDSLQEVLNSDLSILLDQREEGLLVFLPGLNYVVFFRGVEAGADQDPVAVLAGEAKRGCDKLKLIQEHLGLGLTLGHSVELGDGLL